MIIEKIDPARESFSDFILEGTILTIGGVTIDLALEEGDQQVIIPFGSCEGKVHRGLMACCEHVADVVIPPRKYTTVEVDGPPQGTAQGGISENEELPATHTETVPVPLDPESVVLKSWPIVNEGQDEINRQDQAANNQEVEENGSE
ncbi:hypothetical protein AGMMS49944_15960 [Spirochaetia bacterium]|nr:hypothetical protein AGMMS49944_15960 [Spirochaetia bacterium]